MQNTNTNYFPLLIDCFKRSIYYSGQILVSRSRVHICEQTWVLKSGRNIELDSFGRSPLANFGLK